jgi:adenylate kinase
MNIVFLGPPGSGKGTYASRMCEMKGWAHISTGDLLRDAVKKRTKAGMEAKKHMDRGGLVPDGIVIGILKERLKSGDCRRGFIMDGFPRTIKQADELDGMTHIDVAVNLRIPDWVLVEKILARRTCEKCGDLYNIADIRFGSNKEHHMPPMSPKIKDRCDRCEGRLVSRSDETREVIMNRLRVYRERTEPLVEYYGARGLIRNVDVTGSPAVMVPKILKVIGEED